MTYEQAAEAREYRVQHVWQVKTIHAISTTVPTPLAMMAHWATLNELRCAPDLDTGFTVAARARTLVGTELCAEAGR